MLIVRGHVRAAQPLSPWYGGFVVLQLDAGAVRRHRFTVDDVDRMVASGVLGEDDRVELLDGELVDMSPPGPEHAAIDSQVRDLLRRAFGDGFHVRDQQPLGLGEHSRPEPDLAVIPGRPLDWRAKHPSGSDARLVVEVSFSTQTIDRAKALLYARGRVPTYWMLDVEARTLTVHDDPSEIGYRRIAVLRDADQLEIPGTNVRVRVADLLG
jgi:Uma2 family endonuclease